MDLKERALDRRQIDAFNGVTIVPDNIVPAGLGAAIRHLKPPLARQLVAFTRQDWSPLAAAFLEVLKEQTWHRRPASATDVG